MYNVALPYSAGLTTRTERHSQVVEQDAVLQLEDLLLLRRREVHQPEMSKLHKVIPFVAPRCNVRHLSVGLGEPLCHQGGV